MAADTVAREALLTFLGEWVFLPALNAASDDYSLPERKLLTRVKDGVCGTRLKYREEYLSAESVKENFKKDLSSLFGQNLATNMFLVGLKRFEDLKSEFLELCRLPGV